MSRPRASPAPRSPWIDVSVPLHSGMVHWPGDPSVHITRVKAIDRGDACNVSKIAMGAHTGTHMDAPLHFLRGGRGLDQMPLDATLGPARIIEIHDTESITPEELRPHRIRAGERILFKTANSARQWAPEPFHKDFVYIRQDAARYLANRRIRLVGVDYLSVGGFRRDGVETHQALLRAGIWIIEGLSLSGVSSGEYELICLPLRLVHSDGAPARAILRPLRPVRDKPRK